MSLSSAAPASAGLDPQRLGRVGELLDLWAANGRISGAALGVARHGVLVEARGAGRRLGDTGPTPMDPEAVFLVASVTKPVTALAAVLLVERGLLSLSDRATSVIPGFRGGGREEITIRHLLTHTSGLPDMLRENLALRRRHAPLAEFVQATCRCPLLFRPGTRISYQSMGILLLAEIVERLSGLALPVFLRQEVFEPLGMTSTSLGIRDDLRPRAAAVDLPEEQQDTDWHWNSEYWRSLGAPWGGMFSTVGDLLVLLQTILDGGIHHGRRVLSAAAARTMVTDQTSDLAGLTEESRRQQRWGLGWCLGWCDLSSRRAFHHLGATGTLVGADPETGLAAAILTTTPSAPVYQVANAVHGAVI